MRIVISRRSVRGGCLAAAMAGSLFVGATGCGGDEDNTSKAADEAVTGTQLCGGNAMSADAAKALKVMTGSSRFEASGKKYTVTQAAENLVAEYPITPTDGTEDACLVFTPVGTPEVELKISWRVADEVSTGVPGEEFIALKMGEWAVTSPEKALLQFACTSDKLGQSAGAAHIEIGVQRWGMPKKPDDGNGALKDAYATVAHSFSLAMAKELHCEGNGGLPARPSLDPA